MKTKLGHVVRRLDMEKCFPDINDDMNPALDNLASQLRHINKMVGKDDVVTRAKSIRMSHYIGLCGTVYSTFKSKTGFTKEQLLRCAIQHVRQHRRYESHYLSDLVIEEITHRANGIFEISVGS